MKPYYEDASVAMYHGDCRDVLTEFPLWLDLTPSVVITDPPYGMGYYDSDTQVLTTALFERLRGFGPVALFGYPERLIGLCVALRLAPEEWVSWWPTNARIKAFNLHGLLKETECVAVFGDHHFEELRTERGASSRRILSSVRNVFNEHSRGRSHGDDDEMRVGDVWTDAAPGLAFQSHLRLHPNEKPLTVMTRLVAGMSREGQVVLDPFMGSGTTLLAAKQLGRKGIGIEIEERHCEMAAKRLSQETLGLSA